MCKKEGEGVRLLHNPLEKSITTRVGCTEKRTNGDPFSGRELQHLVQKIQDLVASVRVKISPGDLWAVGQTCKKVQRLLGLDKGKLLLWAGPQNVYLHAQGLCEVRPRKNRPSPQELRQDAPHTPHIYSGCVVPVSGEHELGRAVPPWDLAPCHGNGIDMPKELVPDIPQGRALRQLEGHPKVTIAQIRGLGHELGG